MDKLTSILNCKRIKLQNLKKKHHFIGKKVEEIYEWATKSNFQVRIASKDGEFFTLKHGHKENRINLHIKDGKVINFNIG